MRKFSGRLLWFLLLISLASPGRAGETTAAAPASQDKSQYNLFHPTPNELLRSYSADRPSQSVGPYTVDAGHFYFETSIVSYLFDEPGDGTRIRQWNVAPFNFRLGLTNNVEFDLAYTDYVHLRIEDRASGTTTTKSGFGDLILQSKINLLGNDGGSVALGLVPFLKIPTNTSNLGNNSIEGGLGVPLSLSLPAGFTLGLETGVQFLRDGSGYEPAFFNAAIVSHALVGQLSGYVEFYDLVTANSETTNAGFIDAGLVYQILPNAEVDLGCNFGITDAAPDYQPFVGFSFRF